MSTEHKKLTAFLIANGWKNYPTMDKIPPEIIKELWVKKNEGTPQLCLNFTSMLIHSAEANFVELDITGEVNSVWYNLTAYGVSVDEFINKHETIEQDLINAWISIRTPTSGRLVANTKIHKRYVRETSTRYTRQTSLD